MMLLAFHCVNGMCFLLFMNIKYGIKPQNPSTKPHSLNISFTPHFGLKLAENVIHFEVALCGLSGLRDNNRFWSNLGFYLNEEARGTLKLGIY